jgi:hypothetical protein
VKWRMGSEGRINHNLVKIGGADNLRVGRIGPTATRIGGRNHSMVRRSPHPVPIGGHSGFFRGK